VSPRDIQLARHNLQTLENDFLQELSIHADQTSEVVSSPIANLSGLSWQPDLSSSSMVCCDGTAVVVPTNPSPMSPPAAVAHQQNNTYDASRDRLLNMSLGLNSILGSLLQRACTENQVIMQQQHTAETMNALVGAFASGHALSV
jgi:hypothetical protein